MSGFFNSTSLQDSYASILATLNLTTLDVVARERLQSISQRIARFETALIEESVTKLNDTSKYPYDAEGLKREFMDEIFAEVLRYILPSTYATLPASIVGYNIDLTNFDASTLEQKIEFLELYTDAHTTVLGSHTEASWKQAIDTAYNATRAILSQQDPIPFANIPYNGIVTEAKAAAVQSYKEKFAFLEKVKNDAFSNDVIGSQRTANNQIIDLTKTFTQWGIVIDNNTFVGSAKFNMVQVFKDYIDLIDDTFAESQKLKLGPLDENGNRLGVNTVVMISPVTFEVVSQANPTPTPVTFTHVTSISYDVPDPDREGKTKKLERSFLLPEGFDIATFRPNATTGGFDIVYPDGQGSGSMPMVLEIEIANIKMLNSGLVPKTYDVNGVQRMLLQELPFLPAVGGVPAVASEHFMSPMDYLYYWNEARVNYFHSQLKYREAIVSEIQEDLRQANLVLAELEKIAGGTRAQTDKGQPDPDPTNETMDMDLWEAINNTKGGPAIFDATGGDDSHVYSQWQKNRTNLKNYIDTKSSEAQQAMLDYQTMLNRYNNAFEVMAKLQEKLQNLISSQFRNFN